jgi:hypothetical protein
VILVVVVTDVFDVIAGVLVFEIVMIVVDVDVVVVVKQRSDEFFTVNMTQY